MFWEEDAYTRTDELGRPVTLVRLETNKQKFDEDIESIYRNNTSSEHRVWEDFSL